MAWQLELLWLTKSSEEYLLSRVEWGVLCVQWDELAYQGQEECQERKGENCAVDDRRKSRKRGREGEMKETGFYMWWWPLDLLYCTMIPDPYLLKSKKKKGNLKYMRFHLYHWNLSLPWTEGAKWQYRDCKLQRDTRDALLTAKSLNGCLSKWKILSCSSPERIWVS